MEVHVISTVVLSVSNQYYNISYNMKTLLVVAIVALTEALGSYPGHAPSMPYHGPVALPPGFDKFGAPLPVQDTPEVAHAKAVQLSLIAKAGGAIHPSVHHPGDESSSYEGAASWPAPQTHSGIESGSYGGASWPATQQTHPGIESGSYGGASWPATQQTHPGIESGSHGGASWPAPQTHHQPSTSEHIRYHGPIAHSPGYDKHGAPLPVLETPEVAHTKAEHFQNYAKTLNNLIAKGLYEPDLSAQKKHQQQHNSW